ncbi:hypothetical protein BAUCODRAFT_318890 [Baudoinia panamericana UAMH 10762]|uniref:Ig-like domain-containing protein n=1 Tax=Baudoinia panamericana (strain UAMH 10762) TaxID=717646 RepID=M2MX52_BAUPA|nr:uncharacterized protein BAUCODRAFT_318890 [Baudoinia panamericana UAMH 10762]EMC91224.1 hypothetical protein BAUCODRAFT_318890 [Baudoinia panamericana UAMH 10762]
MALPSSPPLLPDDDLPSVPASLSLNSGSGVPIGSHSRKRQHSDFAGFSSDPLFSDSTEDDSVLDVDEQPRRKRAVRGPWWSLKKRGERSLRRTMAKKERLEVADSGVWMGSDASDVSIDGIIASQQKMEELAVEDDNEQQLPTAAPDAEAYAARIIQTCVDGGKEAVDLSDLALNHISNTTLRPLHHLIKSSFNENLHPPSEDEFGPLTPSVKLYLSTNQLTALPTELFSLANITVLSLRNNHLTHLPPAIARLIRLSELNISGNDIRCLPWELLDLVHCRDGNHRQILVRPNPLVQPIELSGPSPLRGQYQRLMKSEDFSRFADTRETIAKIRQKLHEQGLMNLRGELELRLKLGRMLRMQYLQDASRSSAEVRVCREELIYLASSSIRYFGVDGTPLRRCGEDWTASLTPPAYAPTAFGCDTMPSLLELGLRRLQAKYDLPHLLSILPDLNVSPTLASAIQRATDNAGAYGNETCTTCGHKYVVARAEWVEWWFNGYPSQPELSAETVLPFLRRACSWGCARVTEMGAFRC